MSLSIANAQIDLRHGYYSGAAGIFASSLAWFVAAGVAALLSPDRGAASCQEEVSATMNRIMSAALGGLGIALLPRHVADRTPGLVRTPLQGSPEPRIVWQAVHRDLAGVARIRAVLDFLGELLEPSRRTPPQHLERVG